MMDELKDVKRVLNPTEVLLVVDAMTGQEAAGTSKLIKDANDKPQGNSYYMPQRFCFL